ncbi:MAG TPA: VirB8/TrbF family protein [Steroidobacteraceae bacterium]|nr:VirB8/TrbF family protein [Steroidobacteraceae bacterium]
MSPADRRPELDAYFSEAASWDLDRVEQARRSTRAAWRIAGATAVCALAANLALALLLPLKRVDPYLIRVDSSTGVVDVVPVYAGQAPADEAVTRYFLTHYISICERFTLATAESDYEECGAFHGAQLNQSWYALWNPNNPRSPLNVHKDGSTVSAQVESVSFFKRASGVADMAQVRYLKAERSGIGAQERVNHWIATIEYAYATPSADPRIRRWNPLGFKLLDFVAEPEVLREPTATAGAAAAAAAPATAKGTGP